MILRGKVQGTTNALNVKTIVYEALQPVERACKSIRDNVEQQSSIEAELKTEYARWNNSRSITPEMAKREEALRDVNNYLNVYERASDLAAMLCVIILVLEEALEDMKTTLNIE